VERFAVRDHAVEVEDNGAEHLLQVSGF
jgi:hypothetical protein